MKTPKIGVIFITLDIIIFSLSLSLDALGIGMIYALRGILIPFKTKAIIFIVSFVITLFAIFAGSALSVILSPALAKGGGILALFMLGGMMIYKSHKKQEIKDDSLTVPEFYENKKKARQNKLAESQSQSAVRFFYALFSALGAPSICDMDNSRSIDGKEAIFLGLALSVDASAAGIAGGASGLSSFALPFIIASCQIIFLSCGKLIVRHIFTKTIPESYWERISGVLLILIGVLRLIS